MGKIHHHPAQARVEGPCGGRTQIGDRCGLALPGRGKDQRVRGGGVAVDGDRVERLIDIARQHFLKRGRGDLRVGEDIDQHRRHIGRDHARTLGDPCDTDGTAVALDLGHRALGEGIGRHDRAGRHLDPAGIERRGQIRDFRDDPVMRQRFPDDAGRRGKDPRCRYAKRIRHRPGHLIDRGLTGGAGKGVGIAGVHKDRRAAGVIPLALQLRLAVQNAGRAGRRPGEGPGHRRAGGKPDQHHVLAVGVTHRGFDGGELHPRDDRQRRKAALGGEGRNGIGCLGRLLRPALLCLVAQSAAQLLDPFPKGFRLGLPVLVLLGHRDASEPVISCRISCRS